MISSPRRSAEQGPRPDRLEMDKWRASELVLGLVPVVGTHPYPLDELMLMVAAFSYHRPELVVEIGTHHGVSARVWYELAKKLTVRTEIHTIDIADPEHPEFPGQRLGKMIKGLPVTQHIGDGASIAVELISSRAGVPTLLYVDGDHEHDSVIAALRAGALIQDGAIMVHDTFYQPGSSYNHGPYEAIERMLPELDPSQLVHAHNGVPGMSYIGIG